MRQASSNTETRLTAQDRTGRSPRLDHKDKGDHPTENQHLTYHCDLKLRRPCSPGKCGRRPIKSSTAPWRAHTPAHMVAARLSLQSGC